MSNLVIVADLLAQRSYKESGAQADAYGRSAFNRLYYAAFLDTRDLLSAIDAAWKTHPHKGIPELLETTVLDRLRRQAKRLTDQGILSSSREYQIRAQANQAAADIAAIMRVAYSVRVIADYVPEILVSFSGKGFSLRSHSINEARGWSERVGKAKGALLGIARELGIVD